MTTPWPALEKGSGVLKSAASAWRDFAVVTTPSPWALVKAEPPEPRAAILATDLKRETLESLRERVRGASMIVGVGSGLSMDTAPASCRCSSTSSSAFSAGTFCCCLTAPFSKSFPRSAS
jgi:hypothetical protein